MVDMQDQPFASIEKSESEKVVIDKSRRRIRQSIPQKSRKRNAGPPFPRQQAANLAAIAVHVFEINAKCGIGVMQHVALKLALGPRKLRRRVRPHTLIQPRRPAPEKPQLAVRIEPPMPNPSAKVGVEPRNPISAKLRVAPILASQQFTNLILQLRRQHFVRVEQQNP